MESRWRLMWRQFRRSKIAVISGGLLIGIYLIAIFGAFLAPYDPGTSRSKYSYAPPQRIHFLHNGKLTRPFVYKITKTINPKTYRYEYKVDKSTPYPIRFFTKGAKYKLLGLFESRTHLFGVSNEATLFFLGADKFGRDFFSRIIFGLGVSISIPLLGMVFTVVAGSVFGALSGYLGGGLDMLMQRFVEILRSVPRIPLWLALSAAVPANWSSIRVFFGIVVILSLLGWVGLARQVRGKVLSVKQESFISAAKAIGASPSRIIFFHLLPLITSHIVVVATLKIPTYILAESSLSYLGLGIKPPMVSLGLLLKEAQTVDNIVSHTWLLIPGIVIMLIVLSYNFVGDALRDAADPYKTNR